MLFIPYRQFLTLDIASTVSALVIRIQELNLLEKLILPVNCLMAVFFLEEFKKSKYSRYFKEIFDMMPVSCHNWPILFDESERAELKGSPIVNFIEERIDHLYQDWSMIRDAIHLFNFPFEQYAGIT